MISQHTVRDLGYLYACWFYQVLFGKASALTGEEFLGRLKYYANAWLPARNLLIASIANSLNVDPSGKIIVFEQFLPWKVSSRPPLSYSPPVLTVPYRNIFSNLRPSSKRPKMRRPFTSCIQTRWLAHGAFRPCQSPPRASRVESRCQRRGEDCAMTS